MPHVLVWDIETVPDLAGFAAANGHDGKSDDEIRAELGDKFPKHIYHSIICIGALIAHQQDDHWVVDALGAPHVGDRPERDLIAAFVDRIAELNATTCDVQWFIVRFARLALPRNDTRNSGARAIGATVLQSVYGRRNRPVRCSLLIFVTSEIDATRNMSGDGSSGKT